eukprot:1781986-Rhodomonas_salina.2
MWAVLRAGLFLFGCIALLARREWYNMCVCPYLCQYWQASGTCVYFHTRTSTEIQGHEQGVAAVELDADDRVRQAAVRRALGKAAGRGRSQDPSPQPRKAREANAAEVS